MTWVRLDDSFHAHPKLAELKPELVLPAVQVLKHGDHITAELTHGSQQTVAFLQMQEFLW